MKLRKKLKNVVGRIRRRPATRRNEALARAGGPHRTTELTNEPGGEHGAVPSRRISDLRRIENLRQKPWYSVDLPADVMNVVGMIHPDERRLLYTLARDYFSDQGRIVDGGAFLGSSSLALGREKNALPRIYPLLVTRFCGRVQGMRSEAVVND